MRQTQGTRKGRSSVRAFWADQSGVTTIEYGLIATLVSVAIIGALATYGEAMSELYFVEAETVAGVADDAGS